MANEAYVAEKVAEAAKDAKALLLGAIGAMCLTPSNSANVAKELGLSREEIQKARWLALFKKGKTNQRFLGELLEISQNLQKPKELEDKMSPKKGINVPLPSRGFVDKMKQKYYGIDFANNIEQLQLGEKITLELVEFKKHSEGWPAERPMIEQAKNFSSNFDYVIIMALLENQRLIPNGWRNFRLIFPGARRFAGSGFGSWEIAFLKWELGVWNMHFYYLDSTWGWADSDRLVRSL